MWFVAIGLAIAMAVPLVSGGSYTQLFRSTSWRWRWLLGAAVALQIAVDRIDMPFRIGFGLVVASYVLLIGFCTGNAINRGMAVVAIGIALNLLVIVVNSGMPVRIPPDWSPRDVPVTPKHHPQDGRDHLTALGDIIILRAIDSAISFGDLILVVGLCDVTFQGSRRPRRHRRGRASTPSSPKPAVTIDLTAQAPVADRDDVLPGALVAAGVGRVGAASDDALQRLDHP